MVVKEVVETIRQHGTEASIRAVLATERNPDMTKLQGKHKVVFAKLIDILEKKKILKRGNVVSLICAGEGIKDGE